jgi:hypothetical protein
MKTIGGSTHKCQKVCWLLTCIYLHFLDASYVERPQQWTFGSVPCWLWHFDLLMLKWIKQYFNWVEMWRFKGQNRSNHILKYDGQSSFLLSPNLPVSNVDSFWHVGMLLAVVFQGSSLSRHVTWHIERLSESAALKTYAGRTSAWWNLSELHVFFKDYIGGKTSQFFFTPNF